ncbi:hypothetical protein F4808DRAFT_441690 [Astrocystis sublimbata]|nr:hypothetical protein F4808DRAFT_441690 [Astrocystis sublimbata]
MSGRGGRGGRGGARGAKGKPAPPGMPGGDDPSLIVNDKPRETYPKTYKPPIAPHPTGLEDRAIDSFLQFRREYHNTPLYTHPHINSEFLSVKDPVPPRHGRAQMNERYGVKNRATVDPFTAVPTWSSRFVDEIRTVPKLRGTRPWNKDLFPEELWATLDGKDTGGPKGGFQTQADAAKGKKRRLDDDEHHDDDDEHYGDGDDEGFGGHRSKRRYENETEEERKARIEGAGKDPDNDDGDVGDEDEEEEELEAEDDDYDSAEDDDGGGDYNAEAYFDNGDDDDFGDDDVGESAMDF